MVYFDANATTPLCPAATEAVALAERDFWHNPSSPYPAAAAVHNRLEAARTAVARILGCEASQIVFNSGASEGAFSIFHYLSQVFGSEATVAISAVEHPCVRESAHAFFPARTIEIPARTNGIACMKALEALLATQDGSCPALVALMAANNETGVLQPWQEALELCRRYGTALYVDAAQWLGKLPAAGLGNVDFLTGCAHKFGGPKGCGFLKIGSDFTGFQAQRGGSQENGHRAGTENYPAIAGMLAALTAREADGSPQAARWADARSAFEARLCREISGLIVNGQDAPRLANTSSLLLPRYRNTRWVARLAKKGFCLSTGSACASGKSGPSHVLAAMGLSNEQAERTVRVSALWEETRAEDWQALADALIATWQELQAEDNGGGSSLASVISI